MAATNIDNKQAVRYAPLYPYIIKVEQIVDIRNFTTDTLVLNLSYTSMLNQILTSTLFHNVSVEAKINTQSDYKSMQYAFDGTELKCTPHFKKGQLKISYDYQSDFAFMQDPLGTSTFIVPQIYGWNSWYFTNKYMAIDGVTFSTPQQAYFWGNGTKEAEQGRYVVDVQELKSDISFYLLLKEYYVHKGMQFDNISVNMFFTKGFVRDTLFNKSKERLLIARPASDTALKYSPKIIDYIYNVLNELTAIFNPQKQITINIADAFLTIPIEGQADIVWGNSTKCSNDEHLILIDTSKWNTNVLVHEIVHTFVDNVPVKTDSTHYFFAESMIEYLATYIANPDSLARDAAFARKGANINANGPSIFKIRENSVSGDGDNTSDVIYNKVPCDIHKLAKNVGQKKFIALLSQFYAMQNQNWVHFEALIKSQGEVSDSQWAQFVSTL